MFAGPDPNPPSAGSPEPTSIAAARVGGDVVLGDKNVSLNAGGDIVQGDKITQISNIYQAASWGAAKNQRNRQAMIQAVRDIWVNGVLNHSLYGAVLIPLNLEYRPEAVEQPWNLDLRPPGPAAWLVPAGTRKLDLFDQASGALLILGQPGAGKTTSLLELARDLLDRAEQNPTAPVPAIFSLASWTEKHPPLVDWLAEELFRRYDVPRQLGRAWLDDDMLMPLLDGLDEVPLEQRRACLQAINDFRAGHGLAPLVVCCRLADYEALNSRLRLRGAVLVQPLEPAQVDAHLAPFGPSLASLRRAIQEQPRLCELAASPLMLAVMMAVYQGQAGEIALSGSPEEQRARLFSQYVDRMLERAGELRVYGLSRGPVATPGRRAQYSRAQTLTWLSWLARAMQRHSQTIFYLEWIQPSWLPSPRLVAAVTFGSSALVGLLLGLLLSTGSGAPLLLMSLGASGGLIGAMISFTFSEYWAETLKTLRLANQVTHAQRSAAHVVLVALAGLMILHLAGWFSSDHSLDTIINVFVATGSGMVGGYIAYSAGISTVETVAWARQGARAAIRGALKGGAIGVFIMAPIGWLAGLNLTLTEYGAARGPIFVYGGAVISAWIAALFFGVLGVLIGGGVGWLRGSIRTAQLSTRRSVNQGIWRSARSALSVGLPAGFMLAVAAAALVGPLAPVIGGPFAGLTTGLGSIAVFGASMAVLIAVAYGGRALMQHSLLRVLLWRTGATPAPWRYVHFLDYAAERVLLRKVGGGYIFIHPLLMDYLAGLDA